MIQNKPQLPGLLRRLTSRPRAGGQHERRSGVPARLTPWIFLAPSLLCVSAFVLLPFLDAVRRSFFSALSGQFVGLKNYIDVLGNEAFRLAAKNTLLFTVICIPLLVVVSLILALTVNAIKEKRGIFKTSFLIPMAIPVASIVLLWKVLFHQNGLVNAILSSFGGTPVDWIGTDAALVVLVISYLWKNVGYDMVLWLSGISGISESLYEAAQVDGAGTLQRFFRVTLPNLAPTLFTVTVLSLLNSFKVFREAYLVAGDHPPESIYMLQHLFNNWFATLDIDRMCAGAVLLALVVFLLILLLQRLLGKQR